MKIRNVGKNTIQGILDGLGLVSEIEDQGKDWKIRPKNAVKRARVQNMGGNYYLDNYRKDGKKYIIQYRNKWSNSFTIDKNNTGSVMMGQSDWYNLVIKLLEAGATVKLMNKKFIGAENGLSEYNDWVDDGDMFGLIDAEIELRNWTE